MQVEVSSQAATDVEADVHAIGIAEGQELPAALREAAGAADVRAAFKKVALLHAGPARVLVVGLGAPGELDAERLRVAAALAVKQASRFDARTLAWALPDAGQGLEPAAVTAALVEGTILASYRFDRFQTGDDGEDEARLERLVLGAGDAAGEALEGAARVARVAAEAANRARELQDLPSNVATPGYLAERARGLAQSFDSLSADVLDREQIIELGMGGLAAVARGSDEEPQLIVLRHAGGGADGDGPLGLVGKAVTFDTGGISIKPSAKMAEMKMDMTGGAVVLEAMGAIAELELPLDVVAAVPATENMPSGHATKPGDILTQLNGKTVEVNDTDAEGRLILADALTYCVRELGAARLVDLATLTGAVVVALGSTYAALISNDDAWAAELLRAAESTGELAWRLPLHPEYKELIKGTAADLANVSPKRKAGTIYAGSFLEEFVGDTPWAHLDIAGTAWDTGREYVGEGATGFGVRLLVSLARDMAAER